MCGIEFRLAQREVEDRAALTSVGEGDGKFLRHAAEDCFVDVLDAVGGAEDADALATGLGGGGGEAVPVSHEFGFDHAAGFVFAGAALAEDGVNFVNEDDAGLEFAGEGEDGGDELVGVAVPFLR